MTHPLGLSDRSDTIEGEPYRRWTRATLRAFDCMALPGGNPNLLAKAEMDRATKSYRGNIRRLMDARRHYNRDNEFRSTIPLPVAQFAMAGR